MGKGQGDGEVMGNGGKVGVGWFALQFLELPGAPLSIHIPYKEREGSCNAWVEGENSVEGRSDVHAHVHGEG